MKKRKKDNPAAMKTPHFYWKESGGKFLITGEFGYYAWLNSGDFARFIKGTLPENGRLSRELASKGFIRDRLDFADLHRKWRSLNSHLFSGPGLHILVMTLRCNQGCLYCQSGAVGQSTANTDMSWRIARKSVDFSFRTTAPELTIEFQGGEPLLNWDVLKKVVIYARRKEKTSGKRLSLALVSNFGLMTEQKARFLLANEVSVCTSLDGPAKLHNANRPCAGLDSHAAAKKWLRYFQRRSAAKAGAYRIFRPSALLTVTRRSLGDRKSVV